MFKKPLFIAATITLLASVPLYFLSRQQFEITLNNLPLLAMSLFITILIAVFLTTAASVSGSSAYTDMNRETGNVKWFNANKGFGFITRDNGDDIFVHFRSIRGEGHRVLRDGQRVEFSVSEGEKGLQAEDVAVAN